MIRKTTMNFKFQTNKNLHRSINFLYFNIVVISFLFSFWAAHVFARKYVSVETSQTKNKKTPTVARVNLCKKEGKCRMGRPIDWLFGGVADEHIVSMSKQPSNHSSRWSGRDESLNQFASTINAEWNAMGMLDRWPVIPEFRTSRHHRRLRVRRWDASARR